MRSFGVLLVLTVLGCGNVTGDPPADGGTGGAGGIATSGTGGQSTAGTGGAVATGGVGGHAGAAGTGGRVAGSGGTAGSCGGADLTADPNNCGACGNICPPAEQSKPNDSQQLCYKGGCYIPTGNVCTSSPQCLSTYCVKERQGDVLQCQPKPCSVSSDCPSATPNCDDPLMNYARCQPSQYPDGGSALPCICSVN